MNMTSQTGVLDNNVFLCFQNERRERFAILICVSCLLAVFRGSIGGKKPAEHSGREQQAQLFRRQRCPCFLSFVLNNT